MSSYKDEAGNSITHPFMRGPYDGPGIFDMNTRKRNSRSTRKTAEKNNDTKSEKPKKKVKKTRKTRETVGDNRRTVEINKEILPRGKIRCKGIFEGERCPYYKKYPAEACGQVGCNKYHVARSKYPSDPAFAEVGDSVVSRCAKRDKDGNKCGFLKSSAGANCTNPECKGKSLYMLNKINKEKKTRGQSTEMTSRNTQRPSTEGTGEKINIFNINPFSKGKLKVKKKKQTKKKKKKKKKN